MANQQYPDAIEEVMATLIELCRHQKRNELVELLENAHARFDDVNYDNWNGGTTTWDLRLEVPVIVFAKHQPRLEEVEKELFEKLGYLNRLHFNDPLGGVTITPLSTASTALGQRTAPPERDVLRIWREKQLRMFLSHLSRDRGPVAELKSALLQLGIYSFVAHEDIEPSLEWQNEISTALRSMDVLVALFAHNFHESNWTDQEIGWAFGRGVPVIPVRLGTDPYGFVGKIQAISGALEDPIALAERILRAVLQNSHLKTLMRGPLLHALETIGSERPLQAIIQHVVQMNDFSNEEENRARNAPFMNRRLAQLPKLAEILSNRFGKPSPSAIEVDDVPF